MDWGQTMMMLPKAICGYPLPGWRLQCVGYDDGVKLQAAPGWIVSLHSEPMGDEPMRHCRQYRCIMARSLIGPLEAWDEALAIALRENERAASVDTLPKGQDAKQGLAGTEGSAVTNEVRQTPNSSPHPSETPVE